MKKTRKKYQLGTPGGGLFKNMKKRKELKEANYIFTPEERVAIEDEFNKTLALEDEISNANLLMGPPEFDYAGLSKKVNNPNKLANLDIGVSELGMIGQGIGIVAGATGDMINTMKNYKVPNPYDKNTGVQYAMGGNVEEVPVEVEGGEVAELPNGQMQMFQGPTHEQGGVDANLPEGTEIYSERLKHPQTGESMAERKLKREQRVEKLMQLFKKNKNQRQGDKFIKSSIKRVEEQNAIEEEQDMMLQKQFQQQLQMMGEMQQGQPQQYGGGTPDLRKNLKFPTNEGMKDFSLDLDKSQFPNIYEPIELFPGKSTTETITEKTNPYYAQKYAPEEYPFSAGDKLGIASTLFGSVARPIITAANWANTDAPVNTMKNIGDETLTSYNRAIGSVDQDTKRAIGDITTSSRSYRDRLRNTARGVGAIRGLDEMVESKKREQIDRVKQQEVNRLNNLLTRRDEISMRKDVYKAQGENKRFDIEEAQKDAFAKNLSADISTNEMSGRNLAQTLNQNKYNKDLIDAFNKQLAHLDVGTENFDYSQKNMNKEKILLGIPGQNILDKHKDLDWVNTFSKDTDLESKKLPDGKFGVAPRGTTDIKKYIRFESEEDAKNYVENKFGYLTNRDIRKNKRKNKRKNNYSV